MSAAMPGRGHPIADLTADRHWLTRLVGRDGSHDPNPKPCCLGGRGGEGGKTSGACGRPSLSYVMSRRKSITRSPSSSEYPARSRTEGDETPRKSISSPCEIPSRSPDSK